MINRSEIKSAAKCDNWIAKERGGGHRVNYSPWLKAQVVEVKSNRPAPTKVLAINKTAHQLVDKALGFVARAT